MHSMLIGAVALFATGAYSQDFKNPYSVMWTPDVRHPVDRVQYFDVPNDGSCQEIPDSNAYGDYGSKVEIILKSDSIQGNPCMTLYWQHGCQDRGTFKGSSTPLEIPRTYEMVPADKKDRTIYRSYRLLNIADPGVACDGNAFAKMKIPGA